MVQSAVIIKPASVLENNSPLPMQFSPRPIIRGSNIAASRQILKIVQSGSLGAEIYFNIRLSNPHGKFSIYAFYGMDNGEMSFRVSSLLAGENIRVKVFQDGRDIKMDVWLPDDVLGGFFPRDGYTLKKEGRILLPGEARATKYIPGFEGHIINIGQSRTDLTRLHRAHHLVAGEGMLPDQVFPMPEGSIFIHKLSVTEGEGVREEDLSLSIPETVVKSGEEQILLATDVRAQNGKIIAYAGTDGRRSFLLSGRLLSKDGRLLSRKEARSAPFAAFGYSNVPQPQSLEGIKLVSAFLGVGAIVGRQINHSKPQELLYTDGSNGKQGIIATLPGCIVKDKDASMYINSFCKSKEGGGFTSGARLFVSKNGITIPLNDYTALDEKSFKKGTLPVKRVGFLEQEKGLYPKALARERSFEQLLFPYFLAGKTGWMNPFSMGRGGQYQFFVLTSSNGEIKPIVYKRSAAKRLKGKELVARPVTFFPGTTGAEIILKETGEVIDQLVFFKAGQFLAKPVQGKLKKHSVWTVDRMEKIQKKEFNYKFPSLSEAMLFLAFILEKRTSLPEYWLDVFNKTKASIKLADPSSDDAIKAFGVVMEMFYRNQTDPSFFISLDSLGFLDEIIPFFQKVDGAANPGFREGVAKIVHFSNGRKRKYPGIKARERDEAAKELIIDSRVRDRLTGSGRGIVLGIAKKYADKGSVSMEDLVSAGNLGLVRALNKWDPRRGVRFTTYANYWVLKEVLDEIYFNTREIALAKGFNQMLSRAKLFWDKELPPTVEELRVLIDENREEIVKKSKLDVENALEHMVLHWVEGKISFDGESDSGYVFGRNYASPDQRTPEQLKSDEGQLRRFMQHLAILGDKDREAFCLLWGLDGFYNYPTDLKAIPRENDENFLTLKTVGDQLGISWQAAQQRIKRATDLLYSAWLSENDGQIW